MKFRKMLTFATAFLCAFGAVGISPLTALADETEKVTVTFSTNITENEVWANHFFMYQDVNGNGTWNDGEPKKVATDTMTVEIDKGATLGDTKVRFGTDLTSNFDISSVKILVNTAIGDYAAGDVYESGKNCDVDKNAEIQYFVPLADVTVNAKTNCTSSFYDFMYLDLNANGVFDEGDIKFTGERTFKVPTSSQFTILHPRISLLEGIDVNDVEAKVNDTVYTNANIQECPKGEANVVFEYTGACPVVPTIDVTFIDCEGVETVVTVEMPEEGKVDVESPWGDIYTVKKTETISQTGCDVEPEPTPDEPEPVIKPEYVVVFVDCSGNEFKKVKVIEGEDVVAPEGYKFDEKELKAISSDKTVKEIGCPVEEKTPTTKVEKYTITFTDCNGKTVSTVVLKDGDTLTPPSGYTYELSGLGTIKSDMTIKPSNCPVKSVVNTSATNNTMMYVAGLGFVVLCGGLIFLLKKKKD